MAVGMQARKVGRAHSEPHPLPPPFHLSVPLDGPPSQCSSDLPVASAQSCKGGFFEVFTADVLVGDALGVHINSRYLADVVRIPPASLSDIYLAALALTGHRRRHFLPLVRP
ncbi:hypothetical protein HD554DRAFT_2178066 [Boletus coccyginus]|nr:hypothetical protein HD554DRAFT_2178066 [Boletus coccyginus]